ncbi:hypothetical protein LPC08_16285 [Roseomonas sp. OT10]|uniref:hypothetical protein n=1 Tax=Roseomonas cutis TaxID=2897332 RepID=UPI001E36A7C0|nr:hypothetical protein [Roseomonas sp. OT10]UFN47566.1 hypothetical protein LPC08_16285 [Roseomonas sp. OT10]
MAVEDDDTVRLRPARSRPVAAAAPSARPRPAGGHPARWLAAGAAGLALAAAIGWTALRLAAPGPVAELPPPAPVQPVPAVATVPEPAPEPVRLLPEADIADHRSVWPTLLRLAENPRVFVMDFPDLATQGAALNRVAAMIEKAGLPRDRVLPEAEMAAVLARAGETAETYYFGHDYRGADLDRFFAAAARDGLALSEAERWVEAQLARARALAGPGEVALISVAAPGARLDAAARRTILHHEVGHGHDFTLPFYAAHVRRVWAERFTEADRAAFRDFLGREGYDTTNEDLMAGEMQAYLLFTPDERFFSPRIVGLAPERVEDLRQMLRERAPLP